MGRIYTKLNKERIEGKNQESRESLADVPQAFGFLRSFRRFRSLFSGL